VKAKQAHPGSVDSQAEDLLAAMRFGVPELVTAHVTCPRLLEALARADSVPLVLVCGPAGAGKTSLVAEWVRTREADASQTGWVAFEEGDTSFWGHLLECLGRLGLAVPVPGPGSTGVLGKQRLVALAEALADAPERWTVVIDGYEMTSIELAHEVEFLLRHAVGHLRLVFVSRVDPVLPLYRFRLSDSLVEVRAADLAFTDDEAAELLRNLGVTLPDESVHDLNDRLKGWAVGLRFAGGTLATREDPEAAVATVIGQTGDISEYLLGEVLDVQPPEVRRVLLDTCVVDLLRPGLVEELGGPAVVRVLEELARWGSFVETLPDHPGCYRYYPFFRDLLRAQLAFESPDTMAALHRKAATWFRREAMTGHAVTHLAAVAAWEEMAAQLVDGLLVGRVLLEGRDGALGKAARLVPEHPASAGESVVRAASALADGDRALCAEELARARRAVPVDTAPGDPLPVSVIALDAIRAGYADDVDRAAVLVEEAEQVIGVGQVGVRTPSESELAALVRLSKGQVALRRGDLREARKVLSGAVALDTARRFPSFRADCLGYLAVIDALEGYLTRARRTAAQAVALADEEGVTPSDRSPAARAALACVALEQYELKAAREQLEKAAAARPVLGDSVSWSLVESVLAGLERAGGHLQPALARLEAAATSLATTDPWLADNLRVEAARLSVASGRADLAIQELQAVEEQGGPGAAMVAAAVYAEQGRESAVADSLAVARKGQPALRAQVTGLLVEVAMESQLRSPGRARVVLDRSLRLASAEEFRRPFREAGPAVQRLLSSDPRLLREHRWLSRSTEPVPAAHAVPRQRTGSEQQARPVPDVVEELTPKEVEVLGHLEELLTTEEIAEKMFVSVNTVRTHIRNILRKLGVGRRNAAVRKAREMGLFGR
jgi:LuxR family maltose regulon positive regulatory protein